MAKMNYKLASVTWGEEEKIAAKNIIESGNCTMGSVTADFEKQFAEKFGSKFAVFSNSGSSANLLAVSSLLYRNNGKKLLPGDEVIVPAVSWATTYYPIHQCGLHLKFVDVNISDFNIDVKEIEKAITEKTKAIFAVNLLGMPCDFDELNAICEKYDLILLEDNCESMGAKYNDKYCGTFGLIGTFSTFFSHHICTVEGGVCLTDDEELYQIMLSLRAHGWIRNLPDKNLIHNKTGDYIEDTFKFVLPGYNLRPNDIFAAVGIEQLKKLDTLINNRIENYNTLSSQKDKIANKCFNFQSSNNCLKESSWFGFGFLSNDRAAIAEILANKNIECRPIVAGDFTKNPVIKYMNHSIVGNLPASKMIDKYGLFIGNNGVNMKNEIEYFISSILEMP